ncbi:MAG TPA: VWA domain-containing protein [Pyrinomonadaceae bacterium]|jgi:VWFA-related protein|nr:VWA domain-containing protein [Pyrinomonadaceae bacterium]
MRLFLLFVVACALATITPAQRPTATPPPAETPGDVVTTNTELVQTDVMVFDKSGRLVEGLSPDEFLLTVDGKPQPLSFFESIQTGSSREAAQIRSTSAEEHRNENAALGGATRSGRVILFFVDDVHLSNASLIRTRKALNEFIDKRMHDGDQLAIVSTSGQIGFLQQLTNNEAVLREAIERLNYKRNPETYAGRTVISEYQANQVAEHNDRALFNYLVSSTLNEYQLVPPKGGDPRGLSTIAVNNVRNRIRQIEVNSRSVADNTLAVLLSLMRSSAPLPGRKLLFFLSDGFITDTRGSNALTMLNRVTELASRVGIVVYTMEASGIYYDPAVDASTNSFPDGLGSGSSARNWTGESSAMREPLRILADDTGGRALLNSNSIPDSIQEALDETSSYYLLAWRPNAEAERSGKAQLRVTLKNHPELRVRMRRNFYVPAKTVKASDLPKKSPTSKNSTADSASSAKIVSQPETELLAALGSLYPRQALPASLTAGYVQTSDQGLLLRLSMQIARSAFAFDSADEKKEVDVIGAAIDDRGVIVSFKQVLTVTPNAEAQKIGLPVQWNQQLRVPAGLYQVRIALRERGTGRTGGVQQWIEVPEIAREKLQMSSLFAGERKATDEKSGGAPESLLVNVTGRFARSSALRYQTYLSHVAGGPSADVDIEARILQDGETIVALPPAKAPTAALNDNALPYWSELALDGLRPGYYQLQVTATDRVSKSTAVQRMHFVVQ